MIWTRSAMLGTYPYPRLRTQSWAKRSAPTSPLPGPMPPGHTGCTCVAKADEPIFDTASRFRPPGSALGAHSFEFPVRKPNLASREAI